jgi:hypothetical protein
MLPLLKRQPYVQWLLILPQSHQHPKLIRHHNHLEVSLDSSELQHHMISPAFRAVPANLGIVPGYVRGISGLFGSPSLVRIGGTATINTGPKLPRAIE